MTSVSSYSVTFCAAGSLRGVFREIGEAFTALTGISVEGEFGGSGALRERIEEGAAFDLFASADMGHPRRLVEAGLAAEVVRFTGNRLCVIARREIGLTPDNFLDKVLSADMRLGTSTPGSDPSGDYTWKLFDAADALRPGSAAVLKDKARKLMGGGKPPAQKHSEGVREHKPGGAGPLAHLLEADGVDMFILYYTAGKSALENGLPLDVVELPTRLAQKADYGMAVLHPEKPEVTQFADFILGKTAQAILAQAGFVP